MKEPQNAADDGILLPWDATMGVEGVPVTGPSVLQRRPVEGATTAAADAMTAAASTEPACFGDLHLDQVVATITLGREAYELTPYFHAPLSDPDDVAYRHEVFFDLADEARRAVIAGFGRDMRLVREQRTRAAALNDPRQGWRVYLDAALTYCAAVSRLARGLAEHPPRSRGLRALARYVDQYTSEAAFSSLQTEATRIEGALDAVRYQLTVEQDRVVVRRATDAPDDGAAIARAFARFGGDDASVDDASVGAASVGAASGERFSGRRGSQHHRQHRPVRRDDPAMNQIESAVLERVARLHPAAFSALEAFADRFRSYLEPVLATFDREVQFYLATLDYVARFERAGLPFCYPSVSAEDKAVRARDAYDAALAHGLLAGGGSVVCNDFELRAQERIFVVTGANQGGKTTFARTFGQLHYLAALGCPVPAREAALFLFDQVHTHFEQEEDVRTLRGKFQDELMRMHALLEHTTDRSVVILNEALTATTSHDAALVGRQVLSRLLENDVLGVWVTFIDELAALDPAVVSLVCGVDPDDPARRTFELRRRPADGRAHAIAIARAHRLTYAELRRRLST